MNAYGENLGTPYAQARWRKINEIAIWTYDYALFFMLTSTLAYKSFQTLINTSFI